MSGYFVTGTDTNVGKTYVASALARRAVFQGHKVFAFKPIESGCIEGADGRLIGADQEALAVAAGDWQQGPLRGVYRFPLAAAPLVAAEAVGQSIEFGLIDRTIQQAMAVTRPSMLLVEAAGGWRVPLTPSDDTASLARLVALPVLVVARAGLGTINHTLLTLEAILHDGLAVAAVIMSRRPDDDLAAAQRNRLEINRRWPGPVHILADNNAALDRLIDDPAPR